MPWGWKLCFSVPWRKARIWGCGQADTGVREGQGLGDLVTDTRLLLGPFTATWLLQTHPHESPSSLHSWARYRHTLMSRVQRKPAPDCQSPGNSPLPPLRSRHRSLHTGHESRYSAAVCCKVGDSQGPCGPLGAFFGTHSPSSFSSGLQGQKGAPTNSVLQSSV